MKQKFKSVVVENITAGKDVKNYKMLCLPLRKFFGWLMTINPNKVASHKRQTLSAIRMNVTMHYGSTGLPA
ncbi:phage antirepressor N-terminal domain-containing protein [Snodgrassella alvi]|uniref:phage antirepressor N-terminal domain-containing protein n=1 Tax=Snodgrassella alvi TaxID=1196083 RepID=UPI00345F6AA8